MPQVEPYVSTSRTVGRHLLYPIQDDKDSAIPLVCLRPVIKQAGVWVLAQAKKLKAPGNRFLTVFITNSRKQNPHTGALFGLGRQAPVHFAEIAEILRNSKPIKRLKAELARCSS